MKPLEQQEHERVSDDAFRIGYGHDGKDKLWVSYDLGGWIARVVAYAAAPWDGPAEVNVFLDMSDEGISDAVDLAEAGGGVTASVLRSVPLGDARKVLRRLRLEVLARRDEGVYDLPVRMQSLDDWARFARAYARAEERHPQQPVVYFERQTGLSVNTIQARLRRAQELGLLRPHEPGSTWLLLTDEAKRILDEGEGGDRG